MPVLRILQHEEVQELVGTSDKAKVRLQITQEYDQLIRYGLEDTQQKGP